MNLFKKKAQQTFNNFPMVKPQNVFIEKLLKSLL